MMLPSATGLSAVRLAWGGLLIATPGPLYAAATGQAAEPVQRGVIRVLGARHLLQGLVTAIRPTRTVILWGRVADVLHAASCVVAVAAGSQWRRPALVDGVVAAVFVADGVRRGGTGR